MSITPYLDEIISEHRYQPNFIAGVSAYLNKVDDTTVVASDMNGQFDVNTAVGVQLDTIGALVGANRDVGVPLSSVSSSILDDAHYRTLIKATIARNQWDGTIPGIYALWSDLFPTSTLQIIDNQNMSMQAIVTGLTDTVDLDLITAGLIIPKPMGVSVTIIGSTTITLTPYQGSVVTVNRQETINSPTPA